MLRACGLFLYYFGRERLWDFTGTVFGPGLGECFGGEEGFVRLWGETGTVFLVVIVASFHLERDIKESGQGLSIRRGSGIHRARRRPRQSP